MARLRPLVLIGTRPEAIKLAPVVRELERRSDRFETVVVSTGQHRALLQPLLDYFGIRIARDLETMRADHALSDLAARVLAGTSALLRELRPGCVVAQGDTTSVMMGAIASFHAQIPFVHVEAGLRTGDLRQPWPEEFNRRVVSLATTLHCAPTRHAADALLSEGVPASRIRVTGNPVVDALLQTLERERERDAHWKARHAVLGERRVVLVTAHRRENFGEGLAEICAAIHELSARFPDVAFVYPVHPNPRVQQAVRERLGGVANVHLIDPVPYPEFVWLMSRASLILSDSGGVQEEAPTLGTPVLLARAKTERPEAVASGVVEVVGASRQRITSRAGELLRRPLDLAREPVANPYGDGNAAVRIVDWLEQSGGAAP